VFIASFLLNIGDSGLDLIRSALNTRLSITLIAGPWYYIKWSFIVLSATIIFRFCELHWKFVVQQEWIGLQKVSFWKLLKKRKKIIFRRRTLFCKKHLCVQNVAWSC